MNDRTWDYRKAREYAEQRGLKYKWIAKNIGCGAVHLSYCLNGKSVPSFELVYRYAQVVGCPVEEIYQLDPLT